MDASEDIDESDSEISDGEIPQNELKTLKTLRNNIKKHDRDVKPEMQLLIDKLEKYEQILKPKTHRGSSQGSIDSESVDLSENDETSEAIETALAKQDKLTDNELIKLALHFKRSTAKCQYESAKFRTRIEVLEFQLAKYKDNQQPNDKTKQNQGANREKEFEVLIVKMKKRLKEQEDQISTSQQKIEDLKQDLADAKEENT